MPVIISTQAPTYADLLSVLIDDALAGHDPHTVCSLHTASAGADPFALETIKAANPALGVFQNPDEVLQMSESARRMPAREGEDMVNVAYEAPVDFAPRTQIEDAERKLFVYRFSSSLCSRHGCEDHDQHHRKQLIFHRALSHSSNADTNAGTKCLVPADH